MDSQDFYAEYHGHTIPHLKSLTANLREVANSEKKTPTFIYFLGDSTLDNKHWLYDNTVTKPVGDRYAYCAKACNGYDKILRPPSMVQDVAYFVNKFLDDYSKLPPNEAYYCVNASIEESTLGQRNGGALRAQDRFVKENLTNNDILVCSCGGNDIALAPGFCTIVSIMSALFYVSWLSDTDYPPGLGHFVELFGKRTEAFLKNVIGDKKPKLIVVCMLYFLDQNPHAQSWANTTLTGLKYNTKPEILEKFMKRCFESGTKKINIPGCKVVPVPLFESLDGKNTNDYVARVEPSVQGGRKMGKQIFEAIVKNLDATGRGSRTE